MVSEPNIDIPPPPSPVQPEGTDDPPSPEEIQTPIEDDIEEIKESKRQRLQRMPLPTFTPLESVFPDTYKLVAKDGTVIEEIKDLLSAMQKVRKCENGTVVARCSDNEVLAFVSTDGSHRNRYPRPSGKKNGGAPRDTTLIKRTR